MTLKDLLDIVYVFIDESPTSQYNSIISTAINMAYKEIMIKKYKVTVEDLNQTDSPLLPKKIDPRILCYFACYMFFTMDGDDEAKGERYYGLWSKQFNDIDEETLENSFKEEPETVRYIDENSGETNLFPTM